MIKLDYSLESPEERNQLVEQYLEENPDTNNRYLEVLADYLILCMEKQEKKEKKILTDNRLATINKREYSFEGVISQLKNGEDGIYNMIEDNRQAILQPRITITKKDLREIPPLKQLRETIDDWDVRLKRTSGHDAYVMKRALIEMRKDQYLIKTAYRKPIVPANVLKTRTYIRLHDQTCKFDEKGFPIPEGISLMNPKVCQAVLCNYVKLKEACWDDFESDTWYLMHDFDNVCAKGLKDYPLYERLVQLKIDGLQNKDIQAALDEEFGIKYTVEYISSLWRNKIPKLIAAAAEDDFLDYYYLEVERGKYKRCSRCGEVKLAHSKYFTKNKTSKDGWYSLCKACRNSRKKVK